MWISSVDQEKSTFNINDIGIKTLCRRDILSSLIGAGCHHLTVKILRYLDSQSLLAASLVSVGWQRILLSTTYSNIRYRDKIQRRYENVNPRRVNELKFTLDMTRTSIIDVAIDDDLNIFALAASIISGRAHVLVWPFFTRGKRRWIHRFTEYFHPGSLTCLSAGHKLVGLGSTSGKIHIYETSTAFKCLRLTAILAHHQKSIHKIIFFEELNVIISCSDDMTVGVVTICSNGSLLLSKILHGHVSRVRAIDVQGDRVISGSDDRSVKLWSIINNSAAEFNESTDDIVKPIRTMNGHSGPVTGVRLSTTESLALSSAGVTVRLWEVETGVCFKLFQHDSFPVTSMTWISTFRSIATVDSSGKFRVFSLDNSKNDDDESEILTSKNVLNLTNFDGGGGGGGGWNENGGGSNSSSAGNSPTIRRMSRTSFGDNSIFHLESIPHHLTAFSIENKSTLPSLTLYCLDFIP